MLSCPRGRWEYVAKKMAENRESLNIARSTPLPIVADPDRTGNRMLAIQNDLYNLFLKL